MSKLNTNRIGVLVLTPCVVCIVMVLVMTLYCFLALNFDLEKVEFRQLQTLTATASRLSQQKNHAAEVACETLSDDYDVFYEAVAELDEYVMSDELEWTRSVADAVDYVFTDMNGKPLSTTYKNGVKFDMEPIVTKAKEVGTFSAHTFSDTQLLQYSGTVVRNVERQPIGIAVLVTKAYNLGKSADETGFGAENYIFKGDNCVMAPGDSISMSDIVLDPDISTATYMDRRGWLGISHMFGARNYVSSLPVFDCNGEAIGSLVFVGDSVITDGIMRNIYIIMPLLLIVFIGLLVYIFFRLRRKVQKPINQLVSDINTIAEGDLTKSVSVDHACDEIEVIAVSVHRMEDKIRDVVIPISKASEALVNSANQMKNASDSLSNAANRQAASLEEISSSMEEMGANIQQNTDNSIHTNKLAEEIAKATTRLSDVSNDSLEAIRSIADSISEMNDLVSQTNILALNASVEAARAGEHGQGFGVVAKEVGRLAEQTHETASNINSTATNSIAGAEEAYNHVVELKPRIEKINSLVKEITTASIEQNTGVQQVNTAIMDLNRMTQQNAAGAEEIAASSAQMQDMIKRLNEAIAAFKVD